MNTKEVKNLASSFSTLISHLVFSVAFGVQLIPSPFGLPGIVDNDLLVVAETAIFIVVESLIPTPVRINNSFPLETQAQGRDSNPDPKYLQAAGPEDQGATFLSFPGVKLPQAEAKNDGPNGKASQTKGIIAPNEETIKAPNGGNKISTISFMSLKATPAVNQESPSEEGTGLRPNPMTTTLEQDNQVANLRFLTN
ncbi:hypothetical protein DSO57_1001188 [Entomophthora muscae]|uniref:Uncharacterized protein n=1 Tax=Entomophthora muscae TaxID=34485 RepID=A0ACC2TWN9_9FUNG|nr:hypothetical protein DSO57_1001188 [Entomophthora muscae]